MKIEFELNKMDGWWFDLGISFQRTYYCSKKWVFAIGLGVATLYIRW